MLDKHIGKRVRITHYWGDDGFLVTHGKLIRETDGSELFKIDEIGAYVHFLEKDVECYENEAGILCIDIPQGERK